MEEAKESLTRRCQEYHRLIQDKDRQLEEHNATKGDQEQNLRLEIDDLTARVSQLSFLCDKLKGELSERDIQLGRIKSEASQ